MDVKQALERLEDVSSQVEAAVIFEHGGEVLGATLPAPRAKRIAQAGAALLRESESRGSDGGELAQLEVSTPAGSVFVVRHEERAVAATTGPGPTVGLVFYDLKSCLRDLEREEPKKQVPKKTAARRPRRKPDEKS